MSTQMEQNRWSPLVGKWLLLSVLCLLFSGVLALLLGVSRMPGISGFFTDPLIIRRALVVHVDLGVSVWLTAFPVAIFYWSHSDTSMTRWTHFRSRLALFLSVLGVVTFSFGGLRSGEPLLSNYVPLVSNSIFFSGIFLYFLGCALNFIGPEVFGSLMVSGSTQNPWVNQASLRDLRFGIVIGSLYVLEAMIAFAVSYLRVGQGFAPLVLHELALWAGGHALQFVNVAFLLVCWSLLLASVFGSPVITRRQVRIVFGWLGLPLLIIPVLLLLPVADSRFREGFTNLMRWGIFPPVLTYLFMVFPKCGSLLTIKFKSFWKALSDIRFLGFVLSAFLLLSGFVFGFLIQAADLRVPGHYHASIGAVSIGYTLTAVLLFLDLGWISDTKVLTSRLGRVHAWIYGLGQWIFSFGMVIAGSYGMTRKTYGVEQRISHPMQTVGMGVMGLGGLLAAVGGALFFILLWKWRSKLQKS